MIKPEKVIISQVLGMKPRTPSIIALVLAVVSADRIYYLKIFSQRYCLAELFEVVEKLGFCE